MKKIDIYVFIRIGIVALLCMHMQTSMAGMSLAELSSAAAVGATVITYPAPVNATSVAAPTGPSAASMVVVCGPRITPPKAETSYTLSQLRPFLAPNTDFYILTDLNNNIVPINAHDPNEAEIGDYAIPDSDWARAKYKAVFVSTLYPFSSPLFSYTFARPLHEDSEQIERLAGLGLLTTQNKAKYQKIMLFFVVKLSNVYYKFYLTNPWPTSPGEVDATISKYAI